MESERNNIEKEVKEIIIYIMTKGNIQLNKLFDGDISKSIIIFINKLINNYINIYSHKRNNVCRFITFLTKKFAKRPLDNNYRYSSKNKTNIKKLILWIYLMIYRNQLSIMNSKIIKSVEKYLSVKKLYYLLKKMKPILSKLYIDKIFEIEELEIIMKMLIIFTVNDNYKEIKKIMILKILCI